MTFVDSRHMLHKTRPWIRSAKEAEAYLKASFPDFADGVRVGGIQNAEGQSVGVFGAFGCGPDWDSAVVHLMEDEMIYAYMKPRRPDGAKDD